MTMSNQARSPSPTGSVMSFSTVDINQLFRRVAGRTLNAQNDMYMLPVDDEEQERQDVEHKVLFLVLDSLYAAPDLVMAALAPRQGRTPAILDLGTGSGIWAIDMAREFPHADVVGIDLVPPKARLDLAVPPNVRFEVDDVNLDLSHYTEMFNIVHMRSIGQGIKDFRETIHRSAQLLRKNGVILLVAGSYNFYDERRQPLPLVKEGEPGWSACQTLFQGVYELGKRRGGDIDAASRWEEWLNASQLYQNVGTEDIYVPVGPWIPNLDARCTRIAQLLQSDASRLFQTFRPLLLQNGVVDPVTIDRWIATAEREMSEMRPRVFARWRYVWATRTKVPWYERDLSPGPSPPPRLTA